MKQNKTRKSKPTSKKLGAAKPKKTVSVAKPASTVEPVIVEEIPVAVDEFIPSETRTVEADVDTFFKKLWQNIVEFFQ